MSLFVQISDVHLGFKGSYNFWSKVIKEVNTIMPSFVIITGDFSEHSDIEEQIRFKEMLSLFKPPVYLIPGNHEIPNTFSTKEDYETFYGVKRYYSFNYLNYHFIMLDTTKTCGEGGHIDDQQIYWLKKDLANVDAKHILIFMHHPIFGLFKEKYFLVDNPNDILPLIQRHNVKMVLAGHQHLNYEKTLNCVSFINTASIQWNFKNEYDREKTTEDRGFRIIYISDKGVRTIFKKMVDRNFYI